MLMEPATRDFEACCVLSRTVVRVGLTRVAALQASFPPGRDIIPLPGVRFRAGRSLGAPIRLGVR